MRFVRTLTALSLILALTGCLETKNAGVPENPRREALREHLTRLQVVIDSGVNQAGLEETLNNIDVALRMAQLHKAAKPEELAGAVTAVEAGRLVRSAWRDNFNCPDGNASRDYFPVACTPLVIDSLSKIGIKGDDLATIREGEAAVESAKKASGQERVLMTLTPSLAVQFSLGHLQEKTVAAIISLPL